MPSTTTDVAGRIVVTASAPPVGENDSAVVDVAGRWLLPRPDCCLQSGTATIRCVPEQNRADLSLRRAAAKRWIRVPRIRGAVRAAHHHHKYVVAHSGEPVATRQAPIQGVTSFEHAYRLDGRRRNCCQQRTIT